TGSVPFRKAYLQALINVIEVDDHHVRIKGSKDLLEKAVLANRNGPSGCSQMSTRWRAPVRIKLRTHISLKFRYNFARPFHDLRPEWDHPGTLLEIGGGGQPPIDIISFALANAFACSWAILVGPGKRRSTRDSRP